MMNACSANRVMTPLEWVMLLTLSLVWGGSYFFVALAVTALPPPTIVMCRVGIASPALWAFMRLTRQIMPRDGCRFRGVGVAPMQIATGQVTAAAVLLLPLVVLVDRPWQLPPPGSITLLAVLGLALVSTAFAYVLYFRILASAGANNLSLVIILVSPTAILLGILVLGENLQGHHLLGLMLIIAGLIVIDGCVAAFRRDRN